MSETNFVNEILGTPNLESVRAMHYSLTTTCAMAKFERK